MAFQVQKFCKLKGKRKAYRFREKVTISTRCRQCGQSAEIRRTDFYHAAPPRCPACGGLLDR